MYRNCDICPEFVIIPIYKTMKYKGGLAMAVKKDSSTDALVTVVKALEHLDDTDRRWVLQSAATKFSIPAPDAAAGSGGAGAGGAQLGAGNNASGGVQTDIKQLDAKTFMKNKNPRSETQRVACLAYYLNHARDVEAFKTAEITKLNKEARGPDFNVTRAIDNASRATRGFLSAIGKGQKQLTAFGEEIVEALPSQEAVRQLEATKKPGKRGAKGKKKAKGA
jgi:hypothetical protein